MLKAEIETGRALWPLLRPHPWQVAAIVMLGVACALSEGLGIGLLAPLLESMVGNAVAPPATGGAMSAFWRLADQLPVQGRSFYLIAMILAAVTLKNILAYGTYAVSAWLDAEVGHRLRTQLFGQLLSVSYAYWERNDLGRLLDTLGTESWRTTDALAVLLRLVTASCTVLILTGLLIAVSWKLALMVALGGIGISLLVQRATRGVKKLGSEIVEANAQVGVRMLDAGAGIRVIHAFWLQSDTRRRFEDASETIRRLILRSSFVSSLAQPLSELLHTALLLGVLAAALNGRAMLPALLVGLVVIYRLQPQVQMIDRSRTELVGLLGAVRNVNQLLDPRDKPYLVSGTRPVRPLHEGIRFEGVSFCYEPGGPPALDAVTFQIPAGRTTALVGPSGAGKTTLIHLVERFHDPTAGIIRADGVPLPELDLAAWRGALALAGQEMHLFNTTVRENIACGRPDARDAEIETAARNANAHEFIVKLPRGYDTPTGDQGARLSGGECQRISLARAFLRDPLLLILDEATNALDSLSEHAIQEAMERLRRDRTVIVIAHRLATVQNADHVIVLEAGRVVQQGTPRELLRDGGLFARLHALQQMPEPG